MKCKLRYVGQKWWILTAIDKQSRFLYGLRLSKTRSLKDIIGLIKDIKDGLDGKAPKKITTDGWASYPDAIERVFGSETQHQVSTPFADVANSTNRVERVQGSFRDLYRVLRGIKTKETGDILVSGWKAYYNYLREHDSIKTTPAKKAGIDFPYKTWNDFIRRSEIQISTKPTIVTKLRKLPIPRVRTPKARTKPLAPKGMVYTNGSMLSRHHFKGARLRRVN